MSSTVISRREDCKELTTSKALEAIHDTFMGTQDILCFVVIKELLDSVRAKLHDVSCAVGVSNEIGLDTQLCIIISWVAPKDVYD